MKTLLITAGLISALALSSPTVFAGNKHNKHNRYNSSFEDTARVTHVEPLYRTVRVATPQRECSPRSYRQNNHQKSYTSTIAGSIVGGVVGNQFGGGSGKKILTVAGALLGGSMGNDLNYQSPSSSSYSRGEQCHVTERYHQEERIDGYRVTYRYQGQSYTAEMDRHPGNRIPIEVSVRPSKHYY
ncbi:MAG: glycine zipper 2TM domain-containing protein [Methylophaga sp.]|nr:glycine zipper 2TM domain-containing protein [Methylophaga sp.]